LLTLPVVGEGDRRNDIVGGKYEDTTWFGLLGASSGLVFATSYCCFFEVEGSDFSVRGDASLSPLDASEHDASDASAAMAAEARAPSGSSITDLEVSRRLSDGAIALFVSSVAFAVSEISF
jgi:hypothetical protein